MKRPLNTTILTFTGLLALALLAPSQPLPIVMGWMPGREGGAAALATGNVNLVLVWIQSKDDPEIREAFSRTQAVRKLNPAARELADRYFFETLVRIHRAGEGEPYMGLQPAGRDLGPAIPAADKAVASGSVDALARMISDAAGKGVRERFQAMTTRKSFAKADVAAGREYVQAYVEFVHYVEGLHGAVHRGGHEHSANPQAAGTLHGH